MENEGKYPAHVEVEGQDFGEMLLEGEFRLGEWIPPDGLAYFCPSCARVWARVLVEGRGTYPWSLRCANCGEGHMLESPGSLMLLWQPRFNDALPRKALEREFMLALAEFDKQEA